MKPGAKIRSVAELSEMRRDWRREGKVVVQCHGCFDIVHPGHLRYLRFAKDQGDILIVSVTSDEAVGKGPDRPYIGEDLRLESLAAIEYVDFVCLDANHWAGPVLEALEPDVYVKGKEYADSGDARFARERELVEDRGGKVIFSSGEVVYSSTFILSQFRDRFRLEEERVQSFVRQHAISAARLDRALHQFLGKKVLVIGDPILDRYIHCDALSVAAESPILSVMPLREETFLGAGALIARQVVSFGGEATLLTVLGEGSAGSAGTNGSEEARFAAELERADVGFVCIRSDRRPVYTKTRYLVDESKVFKVNSGRYAPLSTATARELVEAAAARFADFDAVIATDFGYGLFGDGVAKELSLRAREAGVPLYVDVSQSTRAHLLAFSRPRLATPTESELRLAFSDDESGLSHLAALYYAASGAERLILTLGKRGAVIFDPPAEPGARLPSDYLPSLAAHPVDAVGAGDVFLATAVLADLAGEDCASATFLASCTSALHVRRLGNEPVDLADLTRFVAGRPEFT